MVKQAKVKRAQKEFLKAMKKKFAEDPTAPSTPLKSHKTPVDVHVTLIPYKNHIFESMNDFIGSIEMDI